MKLPLFTACTLLLSAPLFAQSSTPSADSWWQQAQQTWREGVSTHQFEVENDSLLLKRDDGMYTSGARYRWQSWRSAGQKSQMTEWHWIHDMYSPLDIKLPPALISPREHPYAAWLATGVSFSEFQANGSSYSVGLDLGCVGPCAAGEHVQTALHRLLHQPLPQGWSRQIKNEWGVIANLGWASERLALNSSSDLQANSQLRLGNINTDATLGAIWRYGSLNALPQADATYGYLQAQVHLVGYDATMQGGYFSKENPHTVTPKRAYGQIEAGLQWQRPSYNVRLAVVRRGNTIRELPNGLGAQNYAIVQIGYTPTR